MPEGFTEYAIRPAWLDPSWMLWEQSIEVTTGFSRVGTGRPYEIHQHACDRLEGDPNDFDRVDAIMALRRAVGQRVRMLNEIYQLRELPIATKPKGDLELLSCFGIVRPFMLRRLIDIRNIVEHQDSSPPSVEECLMFADLVWYFLRSTDEVVRLQVETILYVPPGIDVYGQDSHPFVQLVFGEPFNEMPSVDAWLNPSSVAYEPRKDWIKVEPTKIIGHEKAEPHRVSISGKIHGTEEQMRLIYEQYFDSSHFE
jgi:hypothetical protein